METHSIEGFDELEEQFGNEIPEDVAILYSWANMQGADYQDFSANRREYRAQMRRRAAEQMRKLELNTDTEANVVSRQTEIDSTATGAAEKLAAEAAARAESRGSRRDTEAQEHLADTSPRHHLGKKSHSIPLPYGSEMTLAERGAAARKPDPVAEVVTRLPPAEDHAKSAQNDLPQGSPIGSASTIEVATVALSEFFDAEPVSKEENVWEGLGIRNELSFNVETPDPATTVAAMQMQQDVASQQPRPPIQSPVPGSMKTSFRTVPQEHPKESIAARWFGLCRFLTHHDATLAGDVSADASEKRQPPIIAVFSIVGGSGKTSLIATAGRALSTFGERILLAEMSPLGLLPFYFGSSRRDPGAVRVFLPPPGSIDLPVRLVSYDGILESNQQQASVVADILAASQQTNRVLLDLGVGSIGIIKRISHIKPTILVPLLPDMNSVISIDAVEDLFRSILDAEGLPLQPVYFMNQFDDALPLHLDIRGALQHRLAERLLPFSIRRSSAVSEAMAEAITVLDYDANSAVAADYRRVAQWIRTVSAPIAAELRNQRWSER